MPRSRDLSSRGHTAVLICLPPAGEAAQVTGWHRAVSWTPAALSVSPGLVWHQLAMVALDAALGPCLLGRNLYVLQQFHAAPTTGDGDFTLRGWSLASMPGSRLGTGQPAPPQAGSCQATMSSGPWAYAFRRDTRWMVSAIFQGDLTARFHLGGEERLLLASRGASIGGRNGEPARQLPLMGTLRQPEVFGQLECRSRRRRCWDWVRCISIAHWHRSRRTDWRYRGGCDSMLA